MFKVFIVNGYPGVGKDTFVGRIKELGKKDNITVKCYSSIDPIKSLAKSEFGWNGEKTDKDRKFLSDLKRISDEYCNLSMDYMEDKYNQYKYNELAIPEDSSTTNDTILFFMIREPEKIAQAVEKFDAKTILIEGIRPDMHIVSNNDSDINIIMYDYNYHVSNKGSIKDFESLTNIFYKEVVCSDNLYNSNIMFINPVPVY